MLGYSQKLFQWVSALTMKKSLPSYPALIQFSRPLKLVYVGCLPESIVDAPKEGKLKRYSLKIFLKSIGSYLIYHKELNINDSTSTFLTFLKFFF